MNGLQIAARQTRPVARRVLFWCQLPVQLVSGAGCYQWGSGWVFTRGERSEKDVENGE
jgi:hypothetical protein